MEFKFEFEFHLVESLFKISKTFLFSILPLAHFWPIFACSPVTQSPLPLLDLFCSVRRFTPLSHQAVAQLHQQLTPSHPASLTRGR
jgi:hypothetical protein